MGVPLPPAGKQPRKQPWGCSVPLVLLSVLTSEALAACLYTVRHHLGSLKPKPSPIPG